MNNRIPAECFPPGEFLRDELSARGISIGNFSKVAGMSIQEVENIISGKTHIGDYEAERLSSVIGTSSAFWMNSQKSYDKWTASRPTETQVKHI